MEHDYIYIEMAQPICRMPKSKERDILIRELIVKYYSDMAKDDAQKSELMMMLLVDYGFINNVDCDYFVRMNLVSEDEDACPVFYFDCPALFTHNKVTVGIDTWDDSIYRIGIDPSDCFNKIKQCSIIVKDKLNKRSFAKLKETLGVLCSGNKKVVKEWRKWATSTWGQEWE